MARKGYQTEGDVLVSETSDGVDLNTAPRTKATTAMASARNAMSSNASAINAATSY